MNHSLALYHALSKENLEKARLQTLERRKELGISRKEHCRRAGVTSPTLYRWEKGSHGLTLFTILCILEVIWKERD